LKREIALHFKDYRKDEKLLPNWYALVDEIFNVDLNKDYYEGSIIPFLQFQDFKLIIDKTLRDIQKKGIRSSGECLKEHQESIGKILELGVNDQTDIAIDVEEFSKIEFPPRKIIIEPWLKEGSVSMIAGHMGSGKTFLGVTIANGVTTETAVGNWVVKNPIPCVYVDGELEHRDMQDRFIALRTGKRIRKLHLISDSFNVSANRRRINNLLDPNQRAALFKICKKAKDPDIGLLLGLDNISVLCPGIDENKKSDWDEINVWLLDLKKSGVFTLYFHHTGKNGDQRGTSGREDNIDTSILLSLPQDYRPEDGCRFNLHFKKKRVEGAYLYLIQDQEWQLNTKENPYEWILTTSSKKSSEEIFLLLAQGMGVRDIARTLKKAHSYISKIKTKLTAQGYFHVNGDLTEKGNGRLNSSTQDDDLEDE
jgi:putative DNA primase/helicase